MRLLLSVLLVLLFVPSYSGETRLDLYYATPRIGIEPALLDPADPARRRIGALTYLGGFSMHAHDPAFGGFSAMVVEGDRFLLLSDGGNFLRFRMRRLGVLEDVATGALPDGPDRGWRKIERDSESLAFDPASGRLWAGFETYNEIWRYAPGFARAERRSHPPAMAAWEQNLGAESMVRLRNGSFVVIGERAPDDDDGLLPRPGLYFTTDPTVAPRRGFRFQYVAPKGFSPTDVAELPDGDLLVINRRFRLADRFTAVLTLLRRGDIRPHAIVTGRELARFTPPLVHDNFEALAVTREHGATVVWIASDDNQQFWQRSLLLKFRLDLPEARPKARD